MAGLRLPSLPSQARPILAVAALTWGLVAIKSIIDEAMAAAVELSSVIETAQRLDMLGDETHEPESFVVTEAEDDLQADLQAAMADDEPLDRP